MLFFFGQPIFSQMLSLLNKSKITTRALAHKSNHYCKRFSTFQHLITMVYGLPQNAIHCVNCAEAL
ncbi:DUF4372 domain-containing protein [Maribacter antarcticus]|uniref:DUF4372 domain-containing protein n=1 Tax=Maribacter antarcticus TaxID=505250 RepID=UPI00373FD8C0